MEISVMKMGICLCAPLILMLLLTKGSARKIIICLLLGFVACSISDIINGFIMENMEHYSIRVFSAYYSPVVEEIAKMLPVLSIAIAIRHKRNKDKNKKPANSTLKNYEEGNIDSFIVGMSVGVGFAILENVYYMITNAAKISSLEWIFARGFATALMHALCTGAVAYMLSTAFEHKKLFVTGTIAALAMAMTYHSIYNIMIQTEYQAAILLMPIATYMIIFFIRNKNAILLGYKKLRDNTKKKKQPTGCS